MGSFSLFHWVIVILVVTLLFGRGKISDLMGDVAKGINSFKKGLNDHEHPPVAATAPAVPPSQLTGPAPVAAAPQPVAQDAVRPQYPQPQ